MALTEEFIGSLSIDSSDILRRISDNLNLDPSKVKATLLLFAYSRPNQDKYDRFIFQKFILTLRYMNFKIFTSNKSIFAIMHDFLQKYVLLL